MRRIISPASLLIILICLLTYGCGDNTISSTIIPNNSIDYSETNHWLNTPTSITKTVDVFYLYPTVFNKGKDPNASPISEINDPNMIIGAKISYQLQASVFEPLANIYAPYYRQYDANYVLNLPANEQASAISGIPTNDATAAFDYYIHNYNNGRPFILAGHSQGSNVLIYLLSGYLKEHPDAYKRMIAAYIIGYSVTKEYLNNNTHLKFAEGPDDTGTIISYNTEYIGYSGNPENPVLVPGALAINPINWTRDGTKANAEENLGSAIVENYIIIDNNRKKYADAQIVFDPNREIEVNKCTVDPNTLSGLGKVGIYHSYEYLFYYQNLRQNAENRINKYFQK